MNIIILLITISLIIATGFLIAFLWNLKNGQYDDTYSPSVRMLFDDKPAKEKGKLSCPPDHKSLKKISPLNAID